MDFVSRHVSCGVVTEALLVICFAIRQFGHAKCLFSIGDVSFQPVDHVVVGAEEAAGESGFNVCNELFTTFFCDRAGLDQRCNLAFSVCEDRRVVAFGERCAGYNIL